MSLDLKKEELLGVKITVGRYDQILNEIIKMAENRLSSYVCVCNVHMLIEAKRDKAFCNIVNQADITTPDGMPIAAGIRILYGERQDRVAGMDLIHSVLAGAEKNQIGVYFYGSTEEVLQKIKTRSIEEFPRLKISGILSPPFRTLSEAEELEIMNEINKSMAGIVLVALGCPKQEIWMSKMKGKITATMIGVGGAFPVFAGLQKRAPEWMQSHSLEWLFRLYQEPNRLWKRYLLTNTTFLVLFIGEFIKLRMLKKTYK